jgi:antitoxin (DNA-binding transcriptional repressor) of toxin-antitoxin stability system
MKVISIRELHEKTGEWIRQAAHYGVIRVTDRGQTVAKILPEKEPEAAFYFSQRKVSTGFQRLSQSGKLSKGTDSTTIISEDREDR